MLQRISLLVLTLLIISCAGFHRGGDHVPLKESELGVPPDLLTKFAVTEEVKPAEPTPVEVVPEQKIEKKEKVGNKAKVKEVKKNELKGKNQPITKKKEKNIWVNRWQMPNQPFNPGDRALYDVTYFGTIAGTFELKVLPYKYISNREVFHLYAFAQTASIFSLFYRLSDVAESFMDRESLVSHKFSLKLNESWQLRDMVELYDQAKNKMYYWQYLDHVKKGKSQNKFDADIKEYTQDVMSAVFYLRTLQLDIGKTYIFPVVSNGKPWEVEAEVVRKETLVTKAGDFPSIVIKPRTKFEGVLQNTGDMFIWLSDDEHRSILKIDGKVKIGSVIVYLREIEYGKPAAVTKTANR